MSENRTQSYLRALVAPCQAIEEALGQLLNERGVGTGVGAQLDVIGKIVGQARGGLGDDDYRRYIRARVSANRSRGTIEDVLRVVGLVLNQPTATLLIEPQPPASFVLRITGPAISESLAQIIVTFLRVTAAAGVRAIFEPEVGSAFAHFDTVSQENLPMIPALE